MRILFIVLQYLVPQQALSRALGRLADCEWPWLKNLLINRFIAQYGVDMQQAADPEPANYCHFNAFFTRALRDGARTIVDGDGCIASPADGEISQIGIIDAGRIVQAKGQHYSLLELLGGSEEQARLFHQGQFTTIYLSPRDYHRVHMPVSGTLRSMTYIPGDLFSVNQTTADNVPRLFARNERCVCLFDTDYGPMALVLVGAMIVAGIETVWAGQVAPVKRQIIQQHYGQALPPVALEKGAEMGRFKLGSTVIVLFGEGAMQWDADLHAGSALTMGQLLGKRPS